jgi:beta-lactamase regulating signal transducer with metallopeptidase domain
MATLPLWLADYQLLAAALLLGVMLALAALRQPAQRLAVAKSTLAALAALALLCALPGWSLVHLLREPEPSIESIASTAIETSSVSQSDPFLAPPEISANIAPPSPSIEPSAPPQPTTAPAKPINWPAWFIAAYATGSAAVTLWLITGALLARRVRQQATPAPLELQGLLQQICGPEKSPPQLLISPQITAPVALGIRRPAILLPSTFGQSSRSDVAAPSPWRGGLGRGANPAEAGPLEGANTPPPASPRQGEGRKQDESVALAPILAHEWAHLQHRDLHTLAATRLLLILLWPQPLYWLLRRTIRLDQETLADAAAADRAGRLDYAQQLLAWASTASTQRPPRLAGAVGLWEGPSQLKRRIALLLNEQFNVMRSCSPQWRRGALAALAVIAVSLSSVTLQPTNSTAEQPSDGVSSGIATATEKSAEKTIHRAVGMGTLVAVPLDPPKHQPNAFQLYVVDENKQPISGVEATLYSADPAKGTAKPLRSLTTDDAGNAVFDDVASADQIAKFKKMKAVGEFIYGAQDSFYVSLRRPGFATALVYQSGGELALAGGKRTIMLRPAAKLSGRVTASDGTAVPNAVVTAGPVYGVAIDGVNTVTTDGDGRFEFTDSASFSRADARKQNSDRFLAATAVVGTTLQKDSSAPEDPTVNNVSNLIVSHPDFAVTQVEGGDVPGTTNVRMLPAASIVGRVVKHGSGEPAAGVAVHASGFPAVEGADANEQRLRAGHSAVTTTDADGAYRFSNLPAASYDVWADSGATNLSDAPWVSRGIGGVTATPGGPTTAADLLIGPPAVIRVQLIDADTGRAVQLPPGAMAQPFPGRVGGAQFQPIAVQRVPASMDGIFEMRVLPGKSRSGVFVFPDKAQHGAIYQSDDDFELTGEVFDLQPGEVADAKLSVYSKARIDEMRERDQATYRLLKGDKKDEAMAAYTAIIAEFPMHVRARHARANLYDTSGDYAAALADYEAVLKLAPNDAGSKYGAAKFLATIPIDELRDGKRALELTNQLMEQAGSLADRHWIGAILDIQAAAYAELGKFDQAIAAQQKAIDLAPEPHKSGMRERLELFRSNKPSRAPRQAKPTTNIPAEKRSDRGASTSPPLFPLVTKAVELPPASTKTARAVAVPNPTTGLTQLETLDLKFPSDSTWHLIPQPASINLKAAATLGDAVK